MLAQTPPPSSEVRVLGDAGGGGGGRSAHGRRPATDLAALAIGRDAQHGAAVYPEKGARLADLGTAGRVTEVRSNRTSGAMLLSQLPTVLVVLDAPSLADAARREFWSLAEEAAADEQVTVLRPRWR